MLKRLIPAALAAATVGLCPLAALATVTTTTTSVTYAASGSTGTFSVPFSFNVASDLVVTDNGTQKTSGSDYTVSCVICSSGGSVVFTTNPLVGHAIVIKRAVPYTQLFNPAGQGKFWPPAYGSAFDTLEMQIQQLLNGFSNPPASVLPANVTAKLNGIRFADQFANIQAAITDAGTTGAVLIPSSYVGSDTFTNPNSIPIIDLRNGPGSIRGAVSVRDFGAKGDWNVSTHTGTNDTAAVSVARAFAYANQRALYFPKSSGCYAIDNTALDYGTTVSNNTKVTIFGDGQDMSCVAAVVAGQTLFHLRTASDWSQGILIRDLSFNGFSSSDASIAHGIFMESATAAGPSHIAVQNVFVRGFSGHCVYLPKEWHTLLEGVSADDCKDNLIDIGGGNTTVLIRSYAMGVWPGRAGFRIHGSAVMIGCNGINNAYGAGNVYRGDQADWLVAGDEVLTAWAPLTAYTVGLLRQNAGEEYECITAGTSAGSGGPTTIIKDITDGTAHWRHIGGADGTGNQFAKIVCLNCNIESATRTGVRLKANSSIDLFGGNIAPPSAAPPGAAGLIGIWAEFIDNQQMPMLLDGMPFANEVQSAYEHGAVVHVTQGTSAMIRFGGTSNAPGIWNRVSQLPYTQPTITVATNGATGTKIYNAISLNRVFVNGGPLTLTETAPTYGVNVVIDPNVGNFFDITATNGVAFAINNPGPSGAVGEGVAAGMEITVGLINTSGGVLGAVTWGSNYILQTAWVSPGTGARRYIRFLYNGTKWYELWRSAGDVAN